MSFHPSDLRARPIDDISALVTSAFDEFVVRRPKTLTPISLYRRSSRFSRSHIIQVKEADIVHLHWVEGLLHGDLLEALLRKKQGTVFFTLHDMRPFTGGCHFAGDCQGYTGECGECPIVRSSFRKKIRKNLVERRNILQGLEPVFIAPGEWMRERFNESSLMGLECLTIPYALSDAHFTEINKTAGYGAVKLGFIAANLNDSRKGLDVARSLVRDLASPALDLSFQLVGAHPPKNLHHHEEYLGFLRPSVISEWLLGLDFLVFSSLNDNTPLVIAESLAAGTPLLLTGGTGADSMLSLGHDSLNLELATPEDLRAEQKHRRLSKGARATAEVFTPKLAARRIVSAYESRGTLSP